MDKRFRKLGGMKSMARLFALLLLALAAAGCSSGADRSGAADSAVREGTHSSEASEEDAVTANRSGEPEAPDVADSVGEEPAPEREGSKGQRYTGRGGPAVQAGQLTAGEWDDLAAWERFGNLLNGREGDENLRLWSFRSFHRLEVAVTNAGGAVFDAEVLLTDGRGGEVWKARTNAEGKAYLFADIFAGEENAGGSSYTVEVRSGQDRKRFEGIEVPGQGILKVELAAPSSPPEQVDVMFVVDTTGSMQDELDYLEAELKDVIGRVDDEHGNRFDIRVSTNFYRDIHDEYTVKPFPFTKDIDRAVRQIADQEAQGGGDYPEAVEQALRDAIRDHEWSEAARARLLFLVLDAPPHREEQIVGELHGLVREAAGQGIRIVPVASSGVDVGTEYLMRFMSVATGGTYLFLTDDSGIGGDHLEPAAGEFEVKLLNDLLVEIINRYVRN